MVVVTYRIPYTYGETIKIKPMFDVHYGSVNCDTKKFLSYLRDSDENTYFIGGGDLIECISPTDPRYRKSNDLIYGDAVIDTQIKKMTGFLEPYKDKIICMATGNHEDVITKKYGTNPTRRMCESLGTEFLGFSGLIRLILTDRKGGRGRSVVIRLHHGWGGGSRTQGADLTKFSKDLMHWDADIFLYGHVHRKQTDQIPRLGLVGSKLVSKPKTMCICGTYLKTYSNDANPSYSEIKGYPPTEIGGVVVTIKPTSSGVKIKAALD